MQPLIWILPMALASALLVPTGASYADGAIQACVARNGSVRVVADASECRRNESPVSWSIAGPPGPEGPPGSALRVFNVEGESIGIAVDVDDRFNPRLAQVLLDAIGALALVDMETGLVQAARSGVDLRFANDGCTGPVFTDPRHAGRLVVQADPFVGGSAPPWYVARPAVPPTEPTPFWSGTPDACFSRGNQRLIPADEVALDPDLGPGPLYVGTSP